MIENDYYSDEQVKEIAEDVGEPYDSSKLDELKDGLNIAAQIYFNQRQFIAEPLPKHQISKFRKIESLASELLEEMGVGTRGSLNQMQSYIKNPIQILAIKQGKVHKKTGQTVLSENVKSIIQIKRWVGLIAAEKEKLEAERVKSSQVSNPRRSRNKGLSLWIKNLQDIYFEMWGDRPSVTFDSVSDEYKGSFFQFVNVAGRFIDLSISNAGLGKTILRALETMDN